MLGTQFSMQFDMPPPMRMASEPVMNWQPQTTTTSSGEKSKARDIIAAIRTLKQIEEEKRPATPEENIFISKLASLNLSTPLR